jgi:signal transduction histidine kinase
VIKSLADEIKSVDAHVDIDQFHEVYVDGLRPYIYSIFYNLIHNALKYATHERATRITCYNEINNALVKISIEDNGIGIDMRYAKDKIFNLYQRFHTEVTGKGFGLFLTRTQVESMGGTISVKSTPNMGTTFMLEFPVSKDVVAEG